MKKFFMEPEIEIEKFTVEDIITESFPGDEDYDEDWTPIG